MEEYDACHCPVALKIVENKPLGIDGSMLSGFTWASRKANPKHKKHRSTKRLCHTTDDFWLIFQTNWLFAFKQGFAFPV